MVSLSARPPPPGSLPLPNGHIGLAGRSARGAYRLTTLPHTVEKLLSFARRVTLGIPGIRSTVTIVRCGPVVERRARWRVAKTRSGICSVSPV
jgi:hypothetical protein